MKTSHRPRHIEETPGTTSGDEPAALSPQRAFVVHFRRPNRNLAAQPGGRIEHIVSGRSARFSSMEQLLEFVNGF